MDDEYYLDHIRDLLLLHYSVIGGYSLDALIDYCLSRLSKSMLIKLRLNNEITAEQHEKHASTL